MPTVSASEKVQPPKRNQKVVLEPEKDTRLDRLARAYFDAHREANRASRRKDVAEQALRFVVDPRREKALTKECNASRTVEIRLSEFDSDVNSDPTEEPLQGIVQVTYKDDYKVPDEQKEPILKLLGKRLFKKLFQIDAKQTCDLKVLASKYGAIQEALGPELFAELFPTRPTFTPVKEFDCERVNNGLDDGKFALLQGAGLKRTTSSTIR